MDHIKMFVLMLIEELFTSSIILTFFRSFKIIAIKEFFLSKIINSTSSSRLTCEL